MKNYYELLQVEVSASFDDIKLAYRKQSSKYHPDKYPENTKFAEDMMKQINAAYSVLSDPAKRSSYDDWLNSHENNSNNQKKETKTSGFNNKSNSNEKKDSAVNSRGFRFISTTFFVAIIVFGVGYFLLKSNEHFSFSNTINFSSNSQNFKWRLGDSKWESLKAVRFTNGYELKLEEDSSRIWGKKVIQFDKNKKRTVLLENDVAYIEVAYPNAQDAKIAIISDTCSGTICNTWHDSYLVIDESGTLNKYKISSLGYKLDAKFDSKNLKELIVRDVVLDYDKFGSPIKSTLIFHANAGFVIDSAKNYYVDLIGRHPEDYFDSELARKVLVGASSLDKFREFRGNFSGPGDIRVINHRYLAVSGCMRHNCWDALGAILIDMTSDALWLISVEGSKYQTYSSDKIDADDIPKLRNALEQLEIRKDYIFSLTDGGELTLKPKTSK